MNKLLILITGSFLRVVNLFVPFMIAFKVFSDLPACANASIFILYVVLDSMLLIKKLTVP